MPSPPVAPASWATVEPGPRSTGSEILGSRLGIGPAGLDCLDAAFKSGLNRYTGWDISDADHAKAAAIFKRGVHWRLGDQVSQVEVIAGRYDVNIVPNQEGLIARLEQYKGWACLFDQNVADNWPELSAAFQTECFTISEISKNLMTVAEIMEEIDGAPGVVVVGGGVLGDMVGFAAYMMGIPMVLVPTTLLAMADACVGGKTGVNYPPHGKNQVGAFYFPKEVIVWDGWLQTLERRQVNAGVAECLKHMFLSGNMPVAEQIAKGNVAAHLAQIIQVKANIVSQDPAERGLRATLNFGHTLGHALEAHSHKNVPEDKIILHGEAVAVGMAFAILLSHAQGLLSREDMRRMGQVLLDAKILPSQTQLSEMLGDKLDSPALWDDLVRLIAKDKKATGEASKSNWVLLRRPGEAVIGTKDNYLTAVPTSLLANVWDTLLQTL